MREIFQLVGETAAHSILPVADGENLDPILTTMDKLGKSEFIRLAMDDCEDAIRYGHEKLKCHGDGKLGAVFVADGFVTLETGKTDALVVEVRVYNEAIAKCQMVIPYRSANSKKGFAIHRPQVIELENIDQQKFQPLMQAFFEGLERHQQGGRIWSQYYIDEMDAENAISGMDNLTLAEWSALQNAPLLLSAILAANSEDDTQTTTLKKVLAGSAQYQSDLLHSIAGHAISHGPSLRRKLESADIDYLEELSRISGIVDHKLPSAEAKGFKLGLIALAKDIVDAGNNLGEVGGPMSGQEKFTLASIILCLKVDLDS